MRYFMYAMFAALMLGAGCGGDGDKPDPRPDPVDTNNPCAGQPNGCQPASPNGECPEGTYKAGKADGVEYCLTAANPPPCEPDCTAATCGAPNGCGGYCRGTCPQGEECTVSLYCERTDDPCAGCHEPRACVDDTCACPPFGNLREGPARCAAVNGAEPEEGELFQNDDCTWRFVDRSGDEMFPDRPQQGTNATCSMM